MDLNLIKQNLLQALALLDDVATLGEAGLLERDLALEKIRKAYEELRFGSVEQAPATSLHEEIAAAVASAAAVDESDDDDAPEVEIELVMNDEGDDVEAEPVAPVNEVADEEPMEAPVEPETEVEEEPVTEPAPVEESSAEEVVEEVSVEEIAEVKPQPAEEHEFEEGFAILPKIEALPIERPVVNDGTQEATRGELSLFGDDSAWGSASRKVRRNIIKSLYDDDDVVEPAPKADVAPSVVAEPAPQPAPTPAPAPHVEPTPAPSVEPTSHVEPLVEEPKAERAVLGEVLGGDVQVLGDSMSAPQTVFESVKLGSLRAAIGVADRYMLVKELFDGDEKAFDEAIDALDKIDDFDDSMVYIVENYTWNPSSQGARMVVELLQRKLQ